MRAHVTSKDLLVSSLVLFTVGFERLLNAYLIRGAVADLSTPFLIGVLCTGAGGVLALTRLTLRARR